MRDVHFYYWICHFASRNLTRLGVSYVLQNPCTHTVLKSNWIRVTNCINNRMYACRYTYRVCIEFPVQIYLSFGEIPRQNLSKYFSQKMLSKI